MSRCSLLFMASLVPLLLVLLPVEFFILPSMRLSPADYPCISTPNSTVHANMKKINNFDVSNDFEGPYPSPLLRGNETVAISYSVGPLGYHVMISADYDKANIAKDIVISPVELLSKWYLDNEDVFQEILNRYGGVVFRNFGLNDVQEFDQVMSKFHPDLSSSVYVGTAPRKKILGTEHVSSASEVRRFATIPTHLELPYTPSPPRRIYFFAEKPNDPPGGQTVLTDFREVWRKLPAELKDKIARKGMSYERWYFNKDKGRCFDPLKTKSWQDMFASDDREVARALAAKENFTASWNEAGDICLTHGAVTVRRHQHTNEEYWSTHFNVLHGATFAVPFAWSAQIFRSKESALLALAMHAIVTLRNALGYGFGHDMVFGDGTAVSWEEAMQIRRAISRESLIYDHQVGDLVMLDNHRIAHGRSPWFKGDRKVYVALYH